MIEFGILGPLIVRADIGEIRVVGARRRALLVRLVSAAGQPVAAERLADDLWEGSPPAGAKSTLSSHISLLRGLIGSDRIWNRDGGYVLKAAEAEIDAWSFESEVERGRDASHRGQLQAATVLFEHALGRWRGNALADVAAAAWALPDVSRLEGLRLSALEAWIDARLALGEHAEVIPDIEAAMAEHPLQERLTAQLMLALYRSGRQADALRSYRKLEALLGEELGIVPSPEIVALEEAMVLQDPNLTWKGSAVGTLSIPAPPTSVPDRPTESRNRCERSEPVVAAARDPGAEPRLASDLRWLPASDDPAFVGRTEQLEQLLAEWQQTVFRPRIAVIEGKAGVGKTRLVGEAAKSIDAKGGMVLFGRCDEEATRPCQPFGEILDYLASSLPEAEFYGLVAPYADGLSSLSRPVARRLGIEQPYLTPHAESDRYRLLEALTGFLAGVGALRALFLVIDDVQWADPLALVVVRHLLSRLDPTPVTIVATARDEEPEQREAVAGLLGRLDRAVSPTRVDLQGLPRDEVDLLFRHHQPAPGSSDLISEVWRVTQGNPFFVLQVARQLSEGGRTRPESGETVDLAEFHVPKRVQELIDLRISKLTEDAVVLLTVGSVFGEIFALEHTAEVADLNLTRALAAAEELLGRRLVIAQDGDSYRFDHDLVRRAVYDSLAPGRRLRLHRNAGEHLASRVSERDKVPLGEIAHHFAQAAALGPEDVDTAASWARMAGDSEFGQLAFESAARSYESSLTFAQMLPEPDPGLAAELSLRLGEALNGAGETERGKRALQKAFEFAALTGTIQLKTAAALDYGGSLPLATNVDDEHPTQMLEQLLRELDDNDGSTKARCLSRLALWQYRSGPRSRRQTLCDQALALARASGDLQVLAAVLHDRSWALSGPDGCRDQLEAGKEMVAIGETIDDAELILHGQQSRLHALLELGPADQARSAGDEVARLASVLRHPAHLWSSTVYKALCAANEGRFLEAEDLAEAALRLHRPSDQIQALVAYGTQRFQRHMLQGRLSEDKGTLDGIIKRSPGRLSMVAAMLWTEVEAGDIDNVRSLLTAIADAGWSSIPKDLEWWPIMVSSAIAARVIKDQGAADELYRQILPYRSHNCVSAGVAFFGNADHVLGLLAATLGDVGLADDHLRAGILRYDEWSAAPFGAFCRRDLGLLLVGGDERAQNEGRLFLSQSLRDAQRLDMMSLKDDLRSLKGVAGVAR